MKKFSLVSLAIAAALAISPVASAQSWDFSFTADGPGPFSTVSGSGSFDVTSGVVNSLTGTFYLAPGDAPLTMTLIDIPPGFAGSDNTFADIEPYFDFSGISFNAGGQSYNLFDDGGVAAITQNYSSGPTLGFDATQLSLSVPEPGALFTLILCGLGLAGAFTFKLRHGGLLNS